MENNFFTSIVIPTYKRASYLTMCLQALTQLDTDPTTFEVLVVDNNSPDDTYQVTSKFIHDYPGCHIRYFLEEQQGANFARNRGIIEANGSILCFLDDDSPPSKLWLNCILEAFKDKSIGCIGGPAILDYQGQHIPKWLTGDLQGLLSGYELPYEEPTVINTWDKFPFSCNLAIRKSVLDEVGLFRTDLGRSGGNLFAADETELIARIDRAGWKVLYLPAATVRHIVTPERLERSYIYRVGYGLALTNVYLTSDKKLLSTIRWFLSDLWYAIRLFAVFIFAVVIRDRLWFDDYMRFWMVAQRIPIRIKSFLTGQSPKEFKERVFKF